MAFHLPGLLPSSLTMTRVRNAYHGVVMNFKWGDVWNTTNNARHLHSSWLVKMSSSPPPCLRIPLSFLIYLFTFLFLNSLSSSSFPALQTQSTPNSLLPTLLSAFFSLCLVFKSQTPSCALIAIPLAGTALAGCLLKASQILVKNTAILGQTFSPYKRGWCFRHGKSFHPFRPQRKKK